jgi:hypothetical protein
MFSWWQARLAAHKFQDDSLAIWVAITVPAPFNTLT